MKVVVVAAFVFAFISPISASACQFGTVCNATVQRSLTFEDNACLDSQTRRYHAFAIQITANTDIVFRVQSAFFGPAIELVSPSGSVIAGNSGASSAQIAIAVFTTGTYYVTVRNTAIGQGGPYVLVTECRPRGPVEPPRPTFLLSVAPNPLTLPRNATGVYQVTSTPVEGFSSAVAISVENLPLDVTATPTSFGFAAPGYGTIDVQVHVGPGAPNGRRAFTVTGRSDSGEVSIGTAQLFIDAPCLPPTITATNTNVAVALGKSARLSITATGTVPLAYQWYATFSPSTRVPIVGATLPDYETPPLAGPALYWARVTNECGSYDSKTVSVEIAPAPNRRRSVRK